MAWHQYITAPFKIAALQRELGYANTEIAELKDDNSMQRYIKDGYARSLSRRDGELKQAEELLSEQRIRVIDLVKSNSKLIKENVDHLYNIHRLTMNPTKPTQAPDVKG